MSSVHVSPCFLPIFSPFILSFSHFCVQAGGWPAGGEKAGGVMRERRRTSVAGDGRRRGSRPPTGWGGGLLTVSSELTQSLQAFVRIDRVERRCAVAWRADVQLRVVTAENELEDAAAAGGRCRRCHGGRVVGHRQGRRAGAVRVARVQGAIPLPR
jgi:hypothetical protein